MLLIRPIRKDDYDALFQIAEESGHGFTSLPVNDELIEKKIDRSVNSFQKEVSGPGDEGYLFVLEDSETGKVLGTSGIEAAVGLDDAFYHYHLGKVVHSSRALNVYNTVDILTLCNDYTGVTEICTLFLREPYRQGHNGGLLSRFRFLFLADQKQRFSETVIAEMRGISDEKGDSPFWKWLEEHFFSMDFPTADYLTGIGQKVFIAELMPKNPIYVNLLSREAQAVIGQVHDRTLPALKLLKAEGFSCRGYVDIFDAGPTVEAQLDNIRSVRSSEVVTVEIVDSVGAEGRRDAIVSNRQLENFRATILPIPERLDSGVVQISSEAAKGLQVDNGDTIRIVHI